MDRFWQRVRGLPIEIRILDSKDYQGTAFSTYPEEEGWGSRTVENWWIVFESPSPGFRAFLQRWLFFGLLATVSEDQVPTRLFTRSGILTTDLLPLLVKRWSLDRIEKAKRVFLFIIWLNKLLISFEKEWDQLAELRKQAGSRKMTLLECLEESLMPNVLGREILMSIHLVSEFLMSIAGYRILQLKLPQSSKPVFFQGFSHRLTSLPCIRLRENGWCISDLPVLFGQFNTSSLLYLNSLRAPTFSMPMARTQSSSTTCCGGCSEFECLSTKLNEDLYLTKHVDTCCNCKDIQAKPAGILMDGSVPLVVATAKEVPSSEVWLVPKKPSSTYIAISHVWSDGLGNLKENALPYCQLKHLSRLIDRISRDKLKDIYFWLDTFCVPPDAAKQNKAQKFAIERMRETYEDAEAVLVLDSWLLSSNIDSRPDEEILTQIFASRWNRRLWTFQEGALAKSLYFQFSDGHYDLDEGIKRLERNADTLLGHTLRPAIFTRNWCLRRFFRDRQSHFLITDISTLFATFRYRQTSVASDEAICLGTILGLSISKILQTSPKERMQMFWTMISNVPVDFLFYNGPTFDREGLRWAPLSLLRSTNNTGGFEEAYTPTTMRLDTVIPSAIVTPRGLSVELAGLLFTSKILSLQAYIYLQDEEIVYRFNPFDPDGLEHSKPLPYPTLDFAFILNGELPEMEIGIPNQGILAAVCSLEENIICVKKICNGYCEILMKELHQRELDRLPSLNISENKRDTLMKQGAKIPTHVGAKWTAPRQKWIVD